MPKSNSRTGAIPAHVTRRQITRLIIDCATDDHDTVLAWLSERGYEIKRDNPRRISASKIDATRRDIVAEKITDETDYDYL